MRTNLGACEGIVWNLRRSYLVDRGRLEQIVRDFLRHQPEATPRALADFLVREGILNQFQVERVLQGKIQDLVLGCYVVLGTVGFGSMGTVYKVQSRNDGRYYALKLVPRRSMWNVRIARRIVRSLEEIRHPAAVGFVDVNTCGANLYLAWPFVEGETLENLVQRKGRLFPGLAAYYALQTAEGLSACHQQGIIHGLLKPANLMVGPEQQIYILDLGIGSLLSEAEGAKLLDTMSTTSTVTAGLDCRSPENILNSAVRTPAGDQYSLGCVLYFCLSGRYPFLEETAVEKMIAHQVRTPVAIRSLRPEVPKPLAAIVERLMEKTPEKRFLSLEEAAEGLQPFAVTPAVAARLAALEIGGAGSNSDDRGSKIKDLDKAIGEQTAKAEGGNEQSAISDSQSSTFEVSPIGGNDQTTKKARTTAARSRRLLAFYCLAAGAVLLAILVWLLFWSDLGLTTR
jgi:serine/threonine-protein kinase